jgi:hypothetical protein
VAFDKSGVPPQLYPVARRPASRRPTWVFSRSHFENLPQTCSPPRSDAVRTCPNAGRGGGGAFGRRSAMRSNSAHVAPRFSAAAFTFSCHSEARRSGPKNMCDEFASAQFAARTSPHAGLRFYGAAFVGAAFRRAVIVTTRVPHMLLSRGFRPPHYSEICHELVACPVLMR